jgi:hypothetical protein
MQAYCVSNKLEFQVLLTFAEMPAEPFTLFNNAMKTSRRDSEGSHPWVVVPEFGEQKRLHLHLMLPESCDPERLAGKWDYRICRHHPPAHDR